MAFIDDIKPLLPIFLRLIAIWTEIVVFALGLLSVMGIIVVIPTGILLILNIAITAIRYKAKRTAQKLSLGHQFNPKTWVICIDFLAAAAFLALWVVNMWAYIEKIYGDVIDAYVLVGELVIAHLHLFFASAEVHIWRQRKNGAAAARRAEQKDQAKAGVELTTSMTNIREEIPDSNERV